MKQNPFLAACVTMNSQTNKERNIQQASYYIEMAAKNQVQWLLLPELFPYIGPYKNLKKQAESLDGPLVHSLSKLAKKYQMTIFAPLLESSETESDKVYNTLCIFNKEGELIQSYRKIHLFHLEHEDLCISESDGFLPGNSLLSFKHEAWNVACAICYDLRFPELFLSLHKQNPFDILVVPSAFTKPTGQDHWQLLVQARAVEYQSFVLAPNQTGLHYENKESYGHSLIADPWGDIIGKTGKDCGLAIAEISPDRLQSVRKRIPIFANKRKDLYL